MSICTNIFQEIPIEIHIARCLENVEWNCTEVIHPAWFLFWNHAPGARIICEKAEYEVTPEHAFLIPAYTAISGYSEKQPLLSFFKCEKRLSNASLIDE